MKKIKASILFMWLLLTAVSGQAAGVSVCYQNDCQPMTTYEPEQIMAQLEEIFSNNLHEILFCESDRTRCLNRPISFMGHSDLMLVNFKIPFARMSQVKKKENTLEMVLDYQIKANQYYPKCAAPDSSLTLSTSWNGGIRLVSPLFNCRITELGTTQIAFWLDIDYINLDMGVLGGTYRVNVQGDILAEKTGYVLFQVTDNRYVNDMQPLVRAPVVEPKVNPTPANVEKEDAFFDWSKIHWPTINWAEEWTSFKEKALKIIYLEPLE